MPWVSNPIFNDFHWMFFKVTMSAFQCFCDCWWHDNQRTINHCYAVSFFLQIMVMTSYKTLFSNYILLLIHSPDLEICLWCNSICFKCYIVIQWRIQGNCDVIRQPGTDNLIRKSSFDFTVPLTSTNIYRFN